MTPPQISALVPERIALATVEACAKALEDYADASEALSTIERALIRTVAQSILLDNRTAIIKSVTMVGES